eukprot:355666-Chlamydomonas_euryale.AAC.2
MVLEHEQTQAVGQNLLHALRGGGGAKMHELHTFRRASAACHARAAPHGPRARAGTARWAVPRAHIMCGWRWWWGSMRRSCKNAWMDDG